MTRASCDRPSDEELLGRFRDERRSDDFAELHRRHSGDLGRYLARYLGDRALADDVLQDTFLQVYIKCGLYRDGWPARPWLYSLASHRAIDALRRAGRLPRTRLEQPIAAGGPDEPLALAEVLAGDDPDPAEALLAKERERWVRESVAKLPDPMREVLVLIYHQDLQYAEAAIRLQIPVGTVKSRINVAINRLRAMAARSGQADDR